MQREQLKTIPRGMLRRKFEAPHVFPDYVVEEELTSRIFDLDAWRVCLLRAAKGYGKTSLLAQWYEQFEQKSACFPLWMYVDSNDANGRNFALALSALFQQVDERFTSLIEEIYGTYPSEESITKKNERYLVDIINLLDESCDPACTYVVTFAHCEEASSGELARMMLFLNKYMPDNFRFILSGSYFSPMLDDLLLDSSVFYIDPEALHMSEARMEEAGRALLPEVPHEELVSMCRRCDGWPMGLEFQATALKRAKSRAESRRFLDGYIRRFFDNFLHEFADPALEDFLIRTSILGQMTAKSCDYLLGVDDSASTLEFIYSHSFFVSYDPASESYKYDEYFLRYLRHRLVDMGQETVKMLASRASEWFKRARESYEYARCTAITCDYFFLEQSISSSTGLQPPSHAGGLFEYLVLTSPRDFETSFYLAWVSVWAFISLGLASEARLALEHVSTFDLEGLGDACEYADAICMALEGDCASSLERIRDILGRMGDDVPEAFQCLLIHMEAENCERLGRLKESRELFSKSLSRSSRSAGTFYRLFDFYMLAQHYMCMGDFDKTLECVRKGLDACTSDVPIKGGLLAVLAQVHLERGEYEEADACLLEATRLVSSHVNIDIYLDTYTTLARCEWLRGNLLEAYAILSEATKKVGGRCVHRNIDIKVHALRAPIAAELGELSAMREELAILEEYDHETDVFRMVPCYLGYILSLCVQGDCEQALKRIGECRAYMRKYQCNSRYWLALLDVYESMCHEMLGSHTKAKVSLNDAVEIAFSEGYASVFIKGHGIVHDLLVEIAASRKTPIKTRRFIQNSLALFSDNGANDADVFSPGGNAPGLAALTERETELLRLLNQGLSRQEVAASLNVSENTVKTHLKNIYSKLGVSNRAEAYRVSVEQLS